MRITVKDLEHAINQLNSLSKRKYRLEGAYGKWQLQQLIEDASGAVNNVTGFLSTKELYEVLHAIVKYILMEKTEGRQ